MISPFEVPKIPFLNPALHPVCHRRQQLLIGRNYRAMPRIEQTHVLLAGESVCDLETLELREIRHTIRQRDDALKQ